MNFFQSLWHRITRQELIDTLYQTINKNLQTIEELNSQEQEYKNTILEKEKLLKGYADLMAERDEEIEDLISELNTFKPSQEEQTLQSFWDNKYNTGIITYKGRYLVTGEQIPVPVNLLITPNDPVIIQDLKDWKLYNTKEDPETLIPKIYKKYFDKYYKYRFDKDSWGKAEMWEYFYEMREKSKIKKEEKLPYDCDSHAQALAGYYIAAGVPRWRVRVVVGNTSIGAHSTVHAYSMLDNRWHHLNSTYGSTHKTKISSYPKNTDAKNPTTKTGTDIIGIYGIWFSFNDIGMWYDKVEDIPKDLQLQKQ
jgi:hypothetical protein